VDLVDLDAAGPEEVEEAVPFPDLEFHLSEVLGVAGFDHALDPLGPGLDLLPVDDHRQPAQRRHLVLETGEGLVVLTEDEHELVSHVQPGQVEDFFHRLLDVQRLLYGYPVLLEDSDKGVARIHAELYPVFCRGIGLFLHRLVIWPGLNGDMGVGWRLGLRVHPSVEECIGDYHHDHDDNRYIFEFIGVPPPAPQVQGPPPEFQTHGYGQL